MKIHFRSCSECGWRADLQRIKCKINKQMKWTKWSTHQKCNGIKIKWNLNKNAINTDYLYENKERQRKREKKPPIAKCMVFWWNANRHVKMCAHNRICIVAHAKVSHNSENILTDLIENDVESQWCYCESIISHGNPRWKITNCLAAPSTD